MSPKRGISWIEADRICHERICALRAPTVFSERMKNTSVQKTRLLLPPNRLRGFSKDRQLRADVLFIRAQLTIRADGPPSAQVLTPQLEISSDICRYLQANIARCAAKQVLLGDARQPCFLYG
ncbi:MAG: hypothetical protein IH606_06000 [Burkholderiales bacterium]|nr:hypothetical protein [Burkholderiales bacterium]